MKNWLTLLLLILTPALSFADCTLVKTKALHNNLLRSGNAVAYTQDMFVLNDHSLGADNSVTLIFENQSRVNATVIARDFHTDTALVQIPKSIDSIKPCQFKTILPQSGDTVQIQGFVGRDNKRSKFDVQVMNATSRRSTVPGVTSSIEISTELTKGRSGSVLMINGAVAGMISQSTAEGTSLAIPSSLIIKTLKTLRQSKSVNRKYSVDYKTDSIYFRGLKLGGDKPALMILARGGDIHGFAKGGGTDSIVTAGDVHGIAGDVHGIASGASGDGFRGKDVDGIDGKQPTYFVSEESSQELFVTAKLDSNRPGVKFLEKYNNDLYTSLLTSDEKVVLILEIDNNRVSSVSHLLAQLDKCVDCRITDYVIPGANAQSGASKSLNAAFYISQLTKLYKENKTHYKTLITELETLRKELMTLANREEMLAVKDPQREMVLKINWEKIDDKLLNYSMSDAELDIISQIREIMVVLGE